MSNSEPSAIALQGIPCMCDYTNFNSNRDNSSLKVSPPFTSFQIAHEVSNWPGVVRRKPALRRIESIPGKRSGA